jgi:glutathione S-transferase
LMLNRLVMNGDDVPAKLASYAAHQWERASVQQWVMLDRRQWVRGTPSQRGNACPDC